ncbi:MAG: hypothetical protein AAF203_05510 [Pseudomonadota bacterium]
MKNLFLKITILCFLSSFAQAFELVSVTQFELQAEKTHYWESEKATYKKGSLLIFKVDPKTFSHNQSYNNLLMMDGRILEKLDSGHQRDVVAFLSPTPFQKDKSRFLIKNLAKLPEQISMDLRQQSFKQAQINRSLISVNSDKVKIQSKTLQNEEGLYNLAAQELLKIDPQANTYIKHWQ